MGLEGADHPLIAHGPGGGQQGVKLCRVMGVVVVHRRAVIAALVLKPAAGTVEVLQAPGDGLAGDPQHIGRGGGGQRVENVVLAGDVQVHMGVQLAVDHHVEAGAAVEERHIPGIAVRRPVRQREGEHRMTQPRHGLPGSLVVGVGDDIAPLGHQVGEGVEGPLDIRQVLEKVQVVLPHVQDHRHRGEEIQEGIAVFAGFQDDGVSLAHPIARMEHGQGAADHHGGVRLGRHEDVGGHGGGGGFAVGAGDAQGVFIVLHDSAPGLGPLIHGDAPGDGPGDLGILVVDGGGADHQVAVLQVLRRVADGHVDALGPELADGVAFRHVRALHPQAHAQQHLRQGTHTHPADAGQVGPDPGLEKGFDIYGRMHHIGSLPHLENSYPILYYTPPECATHIPHKK